MSSITPAYQHDTSATALKPYLQLPHLLSLTWLAYPILSLIFIIFRLESSLSSSKEAIENAKDDLLAACLAAEKAATAAASMPRFLARATNEQFADAVNGSLKGARAGLVLALTVMEAIINFIVDTYRSTFLCFVELVVRGGLSILIGAAQEFNKVVQSAASGIRTSIQNDVASANSAIKTAFDAVNKVNPFGNITPPQFNIPSLSGLENITLPTDFQDNLVKLNSTLPSFAELKQKVNDLLDTPFELLKKEINDTFSTFHFDSAILPVPAQNTLTFCSSSTSTDLFDDLARDLVKAARIATLILIALVILLIAGNCLLEWYKWRSLQRHLQYTREAWISDPNVSYGGSANAPVITLSDHNLMVLKATSQHPLITRILNTLSAKLRLSPSQHASLQWFFHYIFHPPALACFLIGFFGILSVQLQLLALGPLQAKFRNEAASAVKDFSTVIATKINESMFNQSSVYANAINTRVDSLQNNINNNLFGWVNGTTTTLNNTLVGFYNDVQDVVGAVFDGTVLEAPAKDFVKCIIGSKVDALENALTFLHDNLQLNMPRVNESALVLSPTQVEEATRPIALAAIGSGNDNDPHNQGLLGRLINSYKKTLIKEQKMFFIFLGLWGVVVLMGILILLWNNYGKHWVEGRRRRKFMKEQRGGLNGIVVPFRDSHDSAEGQANFGATVVRPSRWTGSTQVWDRYHTTSSPEHDSGQELKEKKSWGDDAANNPPVMISRPLRLLSFSRFNEAQEANQAKKLKEKVNVDVDGPEDGKSGWFGRAMTVLRKKGSGKETMADNEAALPKNKNLRDLKVEVEVVTDAPRSAVGEIDTIAPPLASRWSVSPDQPRFQSPAKRMLSFSRRMTMTPPGLPVPTNKQPSAANGGVLSPTLTHRSTTSAYPSHQAIAESIYNGSNIPLHHAFAVPSSTNYEPSSANAAGEEAPMRLASPPTRLTALPPPPPPRSRSRPPSNPNFALVNGYRGGQESEPATPIHTRKSSHVDPFATPFDDEWKVRNSRMRESRTGGFAY